MDKAPQQHQFPLELGVSGFDVAASLVGWLQLECGATAGDYDFDGSAVVIPVMIPGRRVVSASTRLRSKIAREHAQQLILHTQELLRRSHARKSRARTLLLEARLLRARGAA